MDIHLDSRVGSSEIVAGAADQRTPRAPARERVETRAALLVFVAVLAAGFVFLVVVGRYRWFFHDEWDFLAGRDGGDIADLLIPHNEHWSTLPILAYRALYRAVGIRSYAPYRALLLALHLTAAVLLRVIMRRSGVNPWIATAAAAVFVLFGSGYANLLWAFQIGFVGALVFGLAHLLLADHDGPVDRRDGFALVAGLAGLLSSAVALTMIPVVGLSVMIRRGWQVALLHTAPFAVLYVAWLAHYRDQHTSGGVGYTPYDISGPRELARFVARGARAAVEAMGQLPGAGWALVALLAVGLPLAYGRLDWAQRRRLSLRRRACWSERSCSLSSAASRARRASGPRTPSRAAISTCSRRWLFLRSQSLLTPSPVVGGCSSQPCSCSCSPEYQATCTPSFSSGAQNGLCNSSIED